jgi:hypothetical protein
MQTDRTVPINKLDFTIRDNEKGTRMLKDVAISEDRNVVKKETEKIIVYKDSAVEIKRTWNANTKVTPTVMVVAGKISKSFRKHMSNIKREHEI